MLYCQELVLRYKYGGEKPADVTKILDGSSYGKVKS